MTRQILETRTQCEAAARCFGVSGALKNTPSQVNTYSLASVTPLDTPPWPSLSNAFFPQADPAGPVFQGDERRRHLARLSHCLGIWDFLETPDGQEPRPDLPPSGPGPGVDPPHSFGGRDGQGGVSTGGSGLKESTRQPS